MKVFLKFFIVIFAIAMALGESKTLKKRIYFNPSLGHRKIKNFNENIRSTSYIKCRYFFKSSHLEIINVFSVFFFLHFSVFIPLNCQTRRFSIHKAMLTLPKKIQNKTIWYPRLLKLYRKFGPYLNFKKYN